MKYINKKGSPLSLEKYKKQDDACFENLPTDIKAELKQQLIDEQGAICCYCGKRILADYHSVIEHIKPKGNPKYAHLQLEYSNMICSCDGGEQDRQGKTKKEKRLFPSHCDDHKNDSIIAVTPLDVYIETMFSYDEEGHIYGKTEKANEAIKILNLDCSTIVHRRKAAFDAYASLGLRTEELKREIARLNRRNKNDQYEEYCFAVVFFIENYLMCSVS